MSSEGTYSTIDTGRSFVAHVGDVDLKFTRALSATLELALEERKRRTVDETRETLTACLVHMAPDFDAASLFDRMGIDEIVRLVRDAAQELRAIPFTEAPASSPPVATDGSTGAGAQASPPISTS